MTEICHHSLSMKYKISTCTIVALTYGNIDCIKKELRRQSEMETSDRWIETSDRFEPLERHVHFPETLAQGKLE